MLEIICGERNEGKTNLALNRVIGDYKYNHKTVVYFSDKHDLEDYHNILVWNDIDFTLTSSAKPYYDISLFTINSIQKIFDIICDMSTSACRPDVVCIDYHVRSNEVKEVLKLERIFPDILFIIVLNTQVFYDAIHKINIKGEDK